MTVVYGAQGASSRVHEVLLFLIRVGLLPVVLQREGCLRVRAVPHFRITSLEANVCGLLIFSVLILGTSVNLFITG